MHRLHPARLLLLGLDIVAPGEIEQRRGAVAQQPDKAFADRAVSGDDVLRIGPRQRWDHLAVVAPRGAPARLHRLHDRDVNAGLAQMQRGRQAGEAGADDDDIGCCVPTNSGRSGPGGVTAAHSEFGQRTCVVFILILSCGRPIVLVSLYANSCRGNKEWH